MECWLIKSVLGPVQGHRRHRSEATSFAKKDMFRAAHQAGSSAASQAVCAAQVRVGGGRNDDICKQPRKYRNKHPSKQLKPSL